MITPTFPPKDICHLKAPATQAEIDLVKRDAWVMNSLLWVIGAALVVGGILTIALTSLSLDSTEGFLFLSLMLIGGMLLLSMAVTWGLMIQKVFRPVSAEETRPFFNRLHSIIAFTANTALCPADKSKAIDVYIQQVERQGRPLYLSELAKFIEWVNQDLAALALAEQRKNVTDPTLESATTASDILATSNGASAAGIKGHF